MSVRCQAMGTDFRSMWVFGMGREERYAAFRCSRPEGHRGKHLHTPHEPPPPLRAIRFPDEHAVIGGIPLLTPIMPRHLKHHDLGTL